MTCTDWSAASLDELIDRLPAFETAADQFSFQPSWERADHPVAVELRARIEAGAVLTDEQWRRALLETNTIRVRSDWPVDHPFAVGIHQPPWLPGAFIKLTLHGRSKDARGGAVMRGCFGPNRHENYSELTTLHPDVTEVRVDVLIETRRGVTVVEYTTLWDGELTIPVRMRPSLDDCIAPVSDARIDAALSRALRTICLAHQEDSAGSHMSVLAVDPLPLDRHLFDGLALSMRLEVLNHDEVVASYPLSPECPRADRDDAWLDLGLGGEFVPELDRFLHRRWDEATAWNLRLVGTTDNVLRHWNADRYWTGSITVPFLETRRRELDREEHDRWVGWWIHWFTQFNHSPARTRD